MTSVAIIGGGPGGLAAAHQLSVAGLSVSLFEAGPEFGGLARSFELGGLTLERYYHFLCRGDQGYVRFLSELGKEHLVRWVDTRMSFFFQGELYPFSSALDLLRFRGIPLAGRLRYGIAMFLLSRLRSWRWLDRRRAVPLLEGLLGKQTYQATWHPLLSVKFPGDFEEISAAWVWHRVRRVAGSRESLFHPESLGHLEGGTQALVDAVLADLEESGAHFEPSNPVERLLIEDGRVTGLITARGGERQFDFVVSAVPLPVFRRMAASALPAEYGQRLAEIDFIGVVCVVLHLARPVTDSFWINVNDPRIPFNGFIEYSNLDRSLTPNGSSIVYVPYYLSTEHPRYAASDQDLVAETLAALALVQPAIGPEDVLASAVSRDPFAQVICPAGFAKRVPGHRTPIEGLFLLESSQLYPSDRTIAGTIDLAREVAGLILGECKETARGQRASEAQVA